MLSTIDLLDLAQKAQGGATDYRIAKLLGLTPSHISSYRRKGVKPSNPVAMRLGELAGVDPLEAVASVNLERASTEEDREIWESMLKRLAVTARARKAS